MAATWRDSDTSVVGEATQSHDAFAANCLKPGERVLIAATHMFFLLNDSELSSGPVFVTDYRIIGGQERIFRKGYKSYRANLADIRRRTGGLLKGVGPLWEWHGVGLVDVKVVFDDPLEGERFTRLMEPLLGA
jgi:hypothetical protein